MLIKDFYTIQNFSFDTNSMEASVLLNPGHPVYKGHFPGRPVVPGVIQIQMVRELAEEALNQKLFIYEVSSAKYLNMIVPDTHSLFIEISYKPLDNGYAFSGILKNKDLIFSKIKIKTKRF